MSAAEALQAAQNAGVEIGIDGDNLVLEASLPRRTSTCGERYPAASNDRRRCLPALDPAG